MRADGDLQAAADRTAADYLAALRVLHQSSSRSSDCGEDHDRWMPPVVKTSSITEQGLDNLWNSILDYQNHLLETGDWHRHRQQQAKYWMWKQFSRMIQMKIRDRHDHKHNNKNSHKHKQGIYTIPRMEVWRRSDMGFLIYRRMCNRLMYALRVHTSRVCTMHKRTRV